MYEYLFSMETRVTDTVNVQENGVIHHYLIMFPCQLVKLSSTKLLTYYVSSLTL